MRGSTFSARLSLSANDVSNQYMGLVIRPGGLGFGLGIGPGVMALGFDGIVGADGEWTILNYPLEPLEGGGSLGWGISTHW